MNEITQVEFKALIEAGFLAPIFNGNYQVDIPVSDVLLNLNFNENDTLYSRVTLAGGNPEISKDVIVAIMCVIEAAGLISIAELYRDAIENLAARVNQQTTPIAELAIAFQQAFAEYNVQP